MTPAARVGFLSFNLAGFALFTLVPVGLCVYISLFNWPLTGGHTKFVGLNNFSTALASYGFWRIVLNTLYFVVVYTTLNLIVSLALAAALSPRAKAVKGKAFLRVVFFLPVVTPLVASSLVWSLLYNQGGIINAALGVVGIPPVPWLNSGAWAMPSIILMSLWLGFGYNMILFIAGMTNIPDSLHDAAAVDGAGPIRRFFSVTIPLLSPLIFFGTLLTLITSFQVFVQAYVLTGGARQRFDDNGARPLRRGVQVPAPRLRLSHRRAARHHDPDSHRHYVLGAEEVRVL